MFDLIFWSIAEVVSLVSEKYRDIRDQSLSKEEPKRWPLLLFRITITTAILSLAAALVRYIHV